MKIKEVAPLWAQEKKRQVKKSTFAAYMLTYSKRILPILGEVEVEEFDKFKAREFAYRLLEEISTKSARDIMIVVKMIVNYAGDEIGLKIHPTTWKIAWPTDNLNTQKIERYTPAQVKKILNYISDNPSNSSLGVLIAITTGMRIGEICALRFSDINFEKKTICVSKTLERIYNFDPTGHKGKSEVIESVPKTKSSNREVPIIPMLLKLLKGYASVSKPDYFVNSGGPRFREPRIFREHAAEIVRKAGVSPVLKFHAFRHTFGTTMIENHIDPKTVSAILGHSDVSITLNLYVHPSEEAKASAVRKGLNKLF